MVPETRPSPAPLITSSLPAELAGANRTNNILSSHHCPTTNPPATVATTGRFVNASFLSGPLLKRNSLGAGCTVSEVMSSTAVNKFVYDGYSTPRGRRLGGVGVGGESLFAPTSAAGATGSVFQMNPKNIKTLTNLEIHKHNILKKLNTFASVQDGDSATRPSGLFVPQQSFWKVLQAEMPLDFYDLQLILKKAVELCSASFKSEEWLFVEQLFKLVAVQISSTLQIMSGGGGCFIKSRESINQHSINGSDGITNGCSRDLPTDDSSCSVGKRNNIVIFETRAKSLDFDRESYLNSWNSTETLLSPLRPGRVSAGAMPAAPAMPSAMPSAVPSAVPLVTSRSAGIVSPSKLYLMKVRIGAASIYRFSMAREKAELLHGMFVFHRHMCLSRDEQWEVYSREAESYWLQRSKKREAELVQDLRDQEEELQRLRDTYIRLHMTPNPTLYATGRSQRVPVSTNSASSSTGNSITTTKEGGQARSRDITLLCKLLVAILRSREIVLERGLMQRAFRHLQRNSVRNEPSSGVTRSTRHIPSSVSASDPAIVKRVAGGTPVLSARSLSPLSRERSRISHIRPTREPQMRDRSICALLTRSDDECQTPSTPTTAPPLTDRPSIDVRHLSPGAVSTRFCRRLSGSPEKSISSPPVSSEGRSESNGGGSQLSSLSTIARPNDRLPLKEVKSQSVYVPMISLAKGKQTLQRRLLHEILPSKARGSQQTPPCLHYSKST